MQSGSKDENKQSFQEKMTYQDMDTNDKVQMLPIKARKIFKKAMKELDAIDLINSDALPLSRPRIRAILRKMKDNLENGMTDYDEKRKLKKLNEPAHKVQKYINGRQAERDLFGMLIKEKQARRAQQERNVEMQKLYDERMMRKRIQYEKMKAR